MARLLPEDSKVRVVTNARVGAVGDLHRDGAGDIKAEVDAPD
jgi:hypothetical protein